MEAGMFEAEEDAGKAHFQQELSRWFESRGIIADLRSHLRHLMITALQNTQIGLKSVDRNSPKVQAYSLMIAEYLFRRGCHYTLSVFTSEVPSLVNFNPEGVLQGGKPSHANRKRHLGNCFQEAEVEEIFNVLGMSSREVEFHIVKSRYLEQGCETSLIELFLQTVVEMATKLQARREVESHVVEGERLLSKKWSSRVVDILVGEKMSPGQVAVLEEAIFRVTESEIRRIMEAERRLRVKTLTEREKRIQEHISKHSDEMFSRLREAEDELTARKEKIDEELAERERHLTEMALEWNTKHQEILHLSRNFHNIETENRSLQKKLKELEEENRQLRMHGEKQAKTIEDLRGEMSLLISKLREATDSNSALCERIHALINRENKEAQVPQDSAKQEEVKVIPEEIPLLWLKTLPPTSDRQNKDTSPKRKSRGFTLKNPQMPHREYANNIRVGSGDAHVSASDVSEDEEVEATLSSSSAEIILGVRSKLQNLEEQTNRLNQNYFEFKQKCASVSSDSSSPRTPRAQSPTSPTGGLHVITRKETFSQTDTTKDTVAKIHKLTETRETRETREPRDPREVRDTREPREVRETRDPREVREPRDPREVRDTREPREVRETRDPREVRETRDPREVRDTRDPRETIDTRDIRDPRDRRQIRERRNFDIFASKRPEVTSPTKTQTRTPTKRQLQNREFFLKTRELMQTIERKQASGWQTSPTSVASPSCSSGDDRSPRIRSPVKATHPQEAPAVPAEELGRKPSAEKKLEVSPPKPRTDAECLNLLQETRIRSPQVSARMPLRQQMLLSESEEEGRSPKAVCSPHTNSSEKASAERKSEGSR